MLNSNTVPTLPVPAWLDPSSWVYQLSSLCLYLLEIMSQLSAGCTLNLWPHALYMHPHYCQRALLPFPNKVPFRVFEISTSYFLSPQTSYTLSFSILSWWLRLILNWKKSKPWYRNACILLNLHTFQSPCPHPLCIPCFWNGNKCIFSYQMSVPRLILRSQHSHLSKDFVLRVNLPLFYTIGVSVSFSAPDRSRQHTNKFCNLPNYDNQTFPRHDSLPLIFLYFSQQISKYFPSFHSFFGYSINLNHLLHQLLSGPPTISPLLDPVYTSSFLIVPTFLSTTSDPLSNPFLEHFSFGF